MDWSARIRTARPADATDGLARVGPQAFDEAVGCRVVKDQRVYAYPL
jgi:hypothetical protein